MTGHLYATRTVTLEYQRHCGGGFEQARRALTERILSQVHADALSMVRGSSMFPLHVPAWDTPRGPECDTAFAARIQREGHLLVVTELSAIPPSHLQHWRAGAESLGVDHG